MVAVWAGRGSGKSELAKRRLVRYLPVHKPWHDPLYFYALPTREQAKRVAWHSLKALIPKHWIAGEPNETELRIKTIFGSTLYVIGMDKPQRFEGVQWDGGIIDESSDQRPGSFNKTISPSLTHRAAWVWRIGVPKRTGRGAAEFRTFCDRAASADDPDMAAFTWPSADILTDEQLRWALENLDDKDFREQYGASWEDAGGLVFYAFDNMQDVSDSVEYNPQLPILVSCDFNVNPMAWTLGHLNSKNKIDIFDELFLRNANTQIALDALHNKYCARHSGSAAGWCFFGDATSRARKTAAPSVTDYLLIKNDQRFRPRRVFFPKHNPAVRARFAETNAMFRNASGERRIKINPRCRNLIADLKARTYVEGTNEPDDYGDIGHITDALGYLIHRLFPIKREMGEANAVTTQEIITL